MDFFPSIHLKLPIATPVGLPDAEGPASPDHRRRRRPACCLHAREGLGPPRHQAREHPGATSRARLGSSTTPWPCSRSVPFARCSAASRRGRGRPATCPPSRSAASRRLRSADIYSFGITCYELACGRQPFRANSTSELLNKHLSDRPRPLTTSQQGDHPRVRRPRSGRCSRSGRPIAWRSLHEFLSRFSADPNLQGRPRPPGRPRRYSMLESRRRRSMAGLGSSDETDRSLKDVSANGQPERVPSPVRGADLRDGSAPGRDGGRLLPRIEDRRGGLEPDRRADPSASAASWRT